MVGAIMAKRRPKTDDEGEEKMTQFNFRCPARLMERMDRAAAAIGTDRSHLLRMMMLKYLPTYEAEGRIITEGMP